MEISIFQLFLNVLAVLKKIPTRLRVRIIDLECFVRTHQSGHKFMFVLAKKIGDFKMICFLQTLKIGSYIICFP